MSCHEKDGCATPRTRGSDASSDFIELIELAAPGGGGESGHPQLSATGAAQPSQLDQGVTSPSPHAVTFESAAGDPINDDEDASSPPAALPSSPSPCNSSHRNGVRRRPSLPGVAMDVLTKLRSNSFKDDEEEEGEKSRDEPNAAASSTPLWPSPKGLNSTPSFFIPSQLKVFVNVSQKIRRLSSSDPSYAKVIAHITRQLRASFMFLSFEDHELHQLASQFEACKFDLGDVIIQQDDNCDQYYYMLTEGECDVLKDGKKLPGKYGTLEAGASFGEQAILFNEKERGAPATIVAAKGGSDDQNKFVTLYRLDGAIFREKMDPEELTKLQERVTNVMKVFDVLSGIDTKIKGKGSIIRPYKPDSIWLSKQWTGTILQYVWRKALWLMVATALFGALFEYLNGFGIGNGLLPIDEYPPDSLFYNIDKIATFWTKIQPLVTFVATFFLVESYKFWKMFYFTIRGIQGRFNDLSLILASTAARGDDGKITPQAKIALDDIARLQRLLHQLYWAAVVKRFNVLHSPEGLSYLLSFRLITNEEFDSLKDVSNKKLGGHHAALTWLTTRIFLAKKRGEIENSESAMETMLDKITKLRGLMGHVTDMYAGRMPLAYVHFVHLLVNALTFLATVSLFPSLYYWAVPAVGVLCVFYNGIFTLSLMFLDPVDNDEKHRKFSESVGFDIGVLIREANTGSLRFEDCALALPLDCLGGSNNYKSEE